MRPCGSDIICSLKHTSEWHVFWLALCFVAQAISLIESGENDLDAGDTGGQTPCHIACYRVRERRRADRLIGGKYVCYM